MSAFRNFEKAVERFNDAQKALSSARAKIEPFANQAASELSAVLNQFASGGLLPEIKSRNLEEHALRGYPDSIAVDRVELSSNMSHGGSLVTDDIRGVRMAQEIVAAAQEKKIPIKHMQNGGNAIQVSEHVKDRERTPEILLEALAAFAEKKGKPDLAISAQAAAERMKTAVTSLRELQ